MSLSIIILAAGKGTRMYSDVPKVMFPLAGKPLLGHVLQTAAALNAQTTVVYGHGGEQVRAALQGDHIRWVKQEPQLGTGHAVMQALPAVDPQNRVLILYGDVPLIKGSTLTQLAELGQGGLALLTAHLANPQGYGRIIRDGNGAIRAIVEQKDANPEQAQIKEINTGFLAAPAHLLQSWLSRVGNHNAQGEYYLTDVVAEAVADGINVASLQPDELEEVTGINDRLQLAQLERYYQQTLARNLLKTGTSIADPARFDVRGELSVGKDVFIDINVLFLGKVRLGDRVHIGPHVVIRDSDIDHDVEILSHSVIDGARIGAHGRIGPFARLRPQTQLSEQVHIGNFVEIKKSTLDRGSKVNHLSYVGDSVVGKNVNIGAGTITCNYDGANKHQTIIEDEVFVGSCTQLVAPLTLGKGATIGAGSTITQDAPPGELSLARTQQTTIKGWKRPVKKIKS